MTEQSPQDNQDSVSLTFAIRQLLNSKKIFLVTFLILLCVGAVIAFSMPFHYAYSRYLSGATYLPSQITTNDTTAAVATDVAPQPLEKPNQFLSELNHYYIKQVLLPYNIQHKTKLTISATSLSGSMTIANGNIYVLNYVGKKHNDAVITPIFNQIVAKINRTQESRLALKREYILAEISKIKSKISLNKTDISNHTTVKHSVGHKQLVGNSAGIADEVGPMISALQNRKLDIVLTQGKSVHQLESKDLTLISQLQNLTTQLKSLTPTRFTSGLIVEKAKNSLGHGTRLLIAFFIALLGALFLVALRIFVLSFKEELAKNS